MKIKKTDIAGVDLSLIKSYNNYHITYLALCELLYKISGSYKLSGVLISWINRKWNPRFSDF